MSDPLSGRSGGILQRASDAGVCPKVLHLDTESDLWQARSSLVVTDTSGADIAMPDEVRIYTVSGVSHAPFRALTKPVMQLPGNQLGYGAFMRALLVALFEWVECGIAPPDSRFPSRADGTLVPLAEARATFPKLPQVDFPKVLNELRLRDHSVEPPIESIVYPVFVQATDGDGNALGGIRHPMVDAPLATHTGWSLRASGYGEGDLFTIQGSMIPFAATEAERQRAGDPRPSLEARYASRDAWAARLAEAVDRLVADRLLLAEDGDRLAIAARESWDVYREL
jgi:Alpha/beta hydrolase domain